MLGKFGVHTDVLAMKAVFVQRAYLCDGCTPHGRLSRTVAYVCINLVPLSVCRRIAVYDVWLRTGVDNARRGQADVDILGQDYSTAVHRVSSKRGDIRE